MTERLVVDADALEEVLDFVIYQEAYQHDKALRAAVFELEEGAETYDE